jgi:hypothetical protein
MMLFCKNEFKFSYFLLQHLTWHYKCTL